MLATFPLITYTENIQIVDKRSATLNLPGKREKQVPIDADHSAMCKFPSAEHPDCEMIMGLIAGQLEAAMIKFTDLERMVEPHPASQSQSGLPKNTS
jgi:hypothetical protein